MTFITSTTARARAALVGLLAAVALLAAAQPAQADLLSSFDAYSSSTQAGAHDDFTVKFDVADPANQKVKTLRFHLPPGLLGKISDFPTCPVINVSKPVGCPEETQVGTALVPIDVGGGFYFPIPGEVHNMVPGRDDVALLAIRVLAGTSVTLVRLQVRPDDYGLDATVDALSNLAGGAEMTLWGVPWDHWTPATQAATERRPFMANPAVCGTPRPVTAEVDGYNDPGKFERYSATLPALTGCEAQAFEPTIWTRGDNPFVNESSSFEFGIVVPQNTDPDGLQTPPLRKVTAVLPEGVSINPSVANGAMACSDGQFGQGSKQASSCPAGSRIGTVGFKVPALPDSHLQGAIYLGEPKPGEQFRVFLEAYGSNVRVKLKGSILPDPKTGRISAIFDDNPEVPASAIQLTFKGGPRGVLAMPSTCGFKPVLAGIDSWGGQSVQTSSTLQIGYDLQGTACPEKLGFDPQFVAGTVDATAGGDAGFTMVFGRSDKEQALGSIDLSLPAGLLGRLTAVPLCPAAKAANGSCDKASLVGDSRVWAGAGTSPFQVQGGKVFLTEPYRDGDVAGLSIVVPAIAGPYDLGTAVVRAGIKVRPDTGLDVHAEALPTIMEGVPLRIRRVQVDLGLKGFMFNPSDCSPKEITGTITSVDGATSKVSSPFQASGCSKLGFSPTMDLVASRPADDQTIGLDVTVAQDAGEARMRRLTLVLPSGLGARLEGPLQTPCSEDDYQHDRCAAASRVGTAIAKTPVVPFPLTAPVHFIENPGGTLPRLGVRLRGGPITVDLLGDVTISEDGRIVTVFDGIPDVPIASFGLSLEQGAQSVLTGSDMCSRKIADLEVLAHSGAISRQQVALQVTGCGTSRSATKGKAKR